MTEKQKVLIVDDEPRNQRIVCETLESFTDFRTASSAEEALEIMSSYQPDLVLLDIMMPGIDGYEVCRRIRANPSLALTKIILVSGKAMIEERLKGYETGADGYMTKPFAPEELLAKAKVFLRLARTERLLEDLNRTLEEKVQLRTHQLMETEAKLVNAAKMSALGEMASGIAHEINTPLATLSMILEQIEDLTTEGALDGKSILPLSKVGRGTIKRISAIINGLRTFSRESSQDPLEPAPLKQIVENTLSLCREKLKHCNIQVQVEPIADDVKIKCRQVQISQVLLNLLSNSCDAILGLKDRWIRISIELGSKNVVLSVTDSGPGIPEVVRAKLFEPFFTTKDIGKGTGLGLSISRGIVAAHHGTLQIDAACANTRFMVELPREGV